MKLALRVTTGGTKQIKTFVFRMPAEALTAVLDAGFNQATMAGARSTYAAAEAWSSTDFRPDLPAFEGVPTLIIHGTADANVPFEGTGQPMVELGNAAALAAQMLATLDANEREATALEASENLKRRFSVARMAATVEDAYRASL